MAHREIEIQYESRPIKANRTGMSQDLVFSIVLDDTLLDFGDSDVEFRGQSDDMVALRFAYEILPLTKVTINADLEKQVCVIDQVSLDQEGPRQWKVRASYKLDVNTGVGGSGTARYGENDNNVLPFIKIQFSIGGGTKNIVKSRFIKHATLATGSSLPAVPPNDECAIGLSEDSIEGTEVPDASMRLQITAYYNPAFVDLAFVTEIRDIIAGTDNRGSYNDDVFLGFKKGEVQLLAASGGGTVVDIIPITFDFSIKKDLDDVADEGFPNITAYGHDYIDYVFFHKHNDDAKRVILTPEARYVHSIASPEDYTRLKIPQPQNPE